MQIVLIVMLVLHVLVGVFWAGSTFTLARLSDIEGERLLGPQMGAATVALITGAVLWYLLHDGLFGLSEQVLMVGVVTALAAAGVQGATVGAARRQLAGPDATVTAARRARIAKGQRLAAGLLAITIVCMVAARLV